MQESVIYKKENSVGRVILNKPPLNIIGIAELESLIKIFYQINTDEEIKIVTIQSALDNFSAGMDINEHSPDKINTLVEKLLAVTILLLECKSPTITLVKGVCLGGGMELALVSDIILSSDKAKYGQPEIKLAHMAPVSINILPVIAGVKNSNEILLTGKVFGADEAKSIGLINKVFDEDKFDNSCNEYVEQFMNLSKFALNTNIKALRKELLSRIKDNQEEINRIYLNELAQHPDSREGLDAFVEKRLPEWLN